MPPPPFFATWLPSYAEGRMLTGFDLLANSSLYISVHQVAPREVLMLSACDDQRSSGKLWLSLLFVMIITENWVTLDVKL